MKLAHREWGSDHATRLVFLHGMGGTAALWRPIASVLEDEFKVIALDQRGHGGSRPVPLNPKTQKQDFSPLDFAGDVIETLQDMGVENAYIVGHSMGVRTAVATAHLDPMRVSGLALIDLGLTGPAGGGLGQALSDFLAVLPDHFPTRAEAKTYMDMHAPEASIGLYLMAVSSVDESGKLTFPFDHESLIQTINASIQISNEEWVRGFAKTGKPVLVFRGEKSLVYSHELFSKEQEMFKFFPNVKFIEISGASHGLPFEKRKEFCKLITQWASQTN
ncbi:MAG: alpha/beta hydrolase [Xanthomonadaceae bacterium]|nr:alpha/beta hydrolase [Xanthomonadaceae bacterium]